MANNLSRTAESRILDWLTGNATTAPVLPLKVRLMTVDGSDTVNGTELVGGTYTPQTVTFPASGGSDTVSNSALVRHNGLPAATISGIEIWDSAGAPARWWHGPLAGGARNVLAGDAVEFPIGDIDISLD